MRFSKFLVLSLLLLSACGGGANPDADLAAKKSADAGGVTTQEEGSATDGASGNPTTSADASFASPQFTRINGELQTRAQGSEVFGSGVIQAKKALEAKDTAQNYILHFTLEKDGALTLISHGDSKLQQGVEIRLARVAASKKLKVLVRASGVEAEWSSFFAALDASQELRLSIDIHNDHGSYAHIVFWNDAAGGAGATDGTILLNSSEDVAGAPGQGYGAQWGLRLEHSALLKAVVGPQRDEH